ncbi:MAG: COX15/CtaA family protein [Anaerolineae bacterium]|nr:COX15/CtaA family protein [Anaerolineae bacterium]
MKHKNFATFAWILVVYTVLVILWGAFVRATGSGAGCGAHWPTCQGDVIHRPQSIETMIELTHRLMSGVFGILVLGLVVWAFRVFPKGDMVQKTAVLTLIFTITESLLGAGLVLFELVAYNVSAARAFAAALHLVNTFLLLGFVTLTAWWGSGNPGIKLKQGKLTWLLGIGLLAIMILSAAGAITALGDTIFPSDTLLEGIQQDVDPAAHFLVRLRVWHPVLAILSSVYLLYLAGYVMGERESANTRRWGKILRVIVVVQLIGGALNVILLAPVWMQMVHLLLADLLWISLTILSASALAVPLPTGDESPVYEAALDKSS